MSIAVKSARSTKADDLALVSGVETTKDSEGGRNNKSTIRERDRIHIPLAHERYRLTRAFHIADRTHTPAVQSRIPNRPRVQPRSATHAHPASRLLTRGFGTDARVRVRSLIVGIGYLA